jgi:hypothetical protein
LSAAFSQYATWSVEDYKYFKKVYARAVKNDHESVRYCGEAFLVGYAKYVIEYLDSLPKFKGV